MQVSESPYPFHHHQPVQMRFNDLDALGHVNNTIYLEYMDFGKTQYITQVLGDKFDMHRETLVIVNINVNFHQITLYGEQLEVVTRVDAISDHTITFEQRVINPEKNEVKVTARTIMVGFNIETDQSMIIPSTWRQCISEYEGRAF